MEEGMQYFYELYESLPRCGPGNSASTRRAFEALTNLPKHPLILDIGCGPGMQSIDLAQFSNGQVIALDNHQPFLDKLIETARSKGVADLITPLNRSMLEMDFEDQTFDMIWSEGAIYFMGFENGLKRCYQLLKPHGYLAVTEVVFLTPDPPKPLVEYWQDEYPAIQAIQGNLDIIESQGFGLIDHFTLPQAAWMDDFYTPMDEALSRLENKYRDNQNALKVFEGARNEIDIYKKYSDHFGYQFFIMQKPA